MDCTGRILPACCMLGQWDSKGWYLIFRWSILSLHDVGLFRTRIHMYIAKFQGSRSALIDTINQQSEYHEQLQ